MRAGICFSLFPGVPLRCTTDELPDVCIKGAELILNGEKRSSILNSRGDLEPVADDAIVREKLGNPLVAVMGDLARIEAVERSAIVLPLLQYGDPAQPSLSSFEHEHFKQLPIVVLGHAPLVVVISGVHGISICPGTPDRHGTPTHRAVSTIGVPPRDNRASAFSTSLWNTKRASALSRIVGEVVCPAAARLDLEVVRQVVDFELFDVSESYRESVVVRRLVVEPLQVCNQTALARSHSVFVNDLDRLLEPDLSELDHDLDRVVGNLDRLGESFVSLDRHVEAVRARL